MPSILPRRLLAPILAASALALAFPALASAAQTLTVQKVGTGTGTVASFPSGINCGPTCSAPFADGSTVSLIAASGSPTLPVQWSGCDSVNGEGKCLVTMSAARSVTATFDLEKHQLTVTKAGAGAAFATVTSSPAAIGCGAACQASLDSGTALTLSAAPVPGVLAAQWAGCDHVNGEDRCEVTMSAAKNVTATFDLQPGFSLYPVTIEKAGNGQGTVTGSPGQISCGSACSAQLITGTALTLSATPSPGSVFAHWSGGGCSGAGPCTTTVKAAKTIKATFTLSGQRTLSVTKAGNGQGTVTAKAVGIECGARCAAQVAAGKAVTLSAKAATGSTFAHWSGACSGTAKTCTVTMSEARSVVATFTGPPPTASKAPACLVPKLKGKTLARARSALSAAHCALGRVSKSKGAKGSLVVRSSSPAAGSTLAAGAKVDLKLRRAARTHKAHRR